MSGKHMSGIRQDWVSDELFPFESRFFGSQRGRMHYIDEGQGEPIVFLHGNPSWSFEFRGPVSRLRDQFRCVAPDHIGFGLSERSQASDSSHPQAHAENFAALLDHRQFKDVTLYLTDRGGPIGLSFAQRYPERVRRTIMANTWRWPVNNERHLVLFSGMISSGIGRFMIRRSNFFVNQVMPRAVGDRKILTSEVNRHYRQGPARLGLPVCLRRLSRTHYRSFRLAGLHLERTGCLCKQTLSSALGSERYCLPSEGIGRPAIRTGQPPMSHLRSMRSFPGGGSTRQRIPSYCRLHVRQSHKPRWKREATWSTCQPSVLFPS